MHPKPGDLGRAHETSAGKKKSTLPGPAGPSVRPSTWKTVSVCLGVNRHQTTLSSCFRYRRTNDRGPVAAPPGAGVLSGVAGPPHHGVSVDWRPL